MTAIKAPPGNLRGTSGFTQVLALVTIGLASLAIGMVGPKIFHVHSIPRFREADLVAAEELRRAGSLFAGDALEARNVLDSPLPKGSTLACNPDAPSPQATLILSDPSGVHSVIYRVADGALVRTFDGVETSVARKVDPGSTGFSLCDNVLSFNLAVLGDKAGNKSMSLRTHLRYLK